MSFAESLIIFLALKKRRVKSKVARAVIVPDIFNYLVKVDCLIGAESRTAGNVIKRIFGADTLCAECAVKAIAKLAHKCKRSAEVDNLTFNFTSLCKTCNSLAYNSIENTFGNVALSCALIEQRLNICFCKHAAS